MQTVGCRDGGSFLEMRSCVDSQQCPLVLPAARMIVTVVQMAVIILAIYTKARHMDTAARLLLHTNP